MSFPGWMDITYFFSPSGFHAKVAILIIFVLTALVVVHQLSVLFNFKFGIDTFKKPDTSLVRKSGVIFAYPGVWVVCLVSLFFFSHPTLKTQFKDYLFTRSVNFYYEPQFRLIELPSGASLNQEISLQKGRVKKAGLFLDRSIDAAGRIEILDIQAGVENKIFVNDLPRLGKGWAVSIPQSYFARDKIVHFRLTNVSPDPIKFSVRRRPKFAEGFPLTLIPEDGNEEIIDGGVLGIYVLEEPLFLHDPDLPFRYIKQAFAQEKNFLIFWLMLLAVCGAKTLQYARREAGDKAELS